MHCKGQIHGNMYKFCFLKTHFDAFRAYLCFFRWESFLNELKQTFILKNCVLSDLFDFCWRDCSLSAPASCWTCGSCCRRAKVRPPCPAACMVAKSYGFPRLIVLIAVPDLTDRTFVVWLVFCTVNFWRFGMHVHIYIYTYMYISLCVCVSVTSFSHFMCSILLRGGVVEFKGSCPQPFCQQYRGSDFTPCRVLLNSQHAFGPRCRWKGEGLHQAGWEWWACSRYLQFVHVPEVLQFDVHPESDPFFGAHSPWQ